MADRFFGAAIRTRVKSHRFPFRFPVLCGKTAGRVLGNRQYVYILTHRTTQIHRNGIIVVPRSALGRTARFRRRNNKWRRSRAAAPRFDDPRGRFFRYFRFFITIVIVVFQWSDSRGHRSFRIYVKSIVTTGYERIVRHRPTL